MPLPVGLLGCGVVTLAGPTMTITAETLDGASLKPHWLLPR
ncbi:hypothetical protein N624_0376 [Levilactobacillus brevis]|nr:hypothetical protein N624_0376 [Levilactobacillus brevis]